ADLDCINGNHSSICNLRSPAISGVRGGTKVRIVYLEDEQIILTRLNYELQLRRRNDGGVCRVFSQFERGACPKIPRGFAVHACPQTPQVAGPRWRGDPAGPSASRRHIQCVPAVNSREKENI